MDGRDAVQAPALGLARKHAGIRILALRFDSSQSPFLVLDGERWGVPEASSGGWVRFPGCPYSRRGSGLIISQEESPCNGRGKPGAWGRIDSSRSPFQLPRIPRQLASGGCRCCPAAMGADPRLPSRRIAWCVSLGRARRVLEWRPVRSRHGAYPNDGGCLDSATTLGVYRRFWPGIVGSTPTGAISRQREAYPRWGITRLGLEDARCTPSGIQQGRGDLEVRCQVRLLAGSLGRLQVLPWRG